MKTRNLKNSTRQTLRKAHGFTLLEMLMVILVILVIAGLAMPMLLGAIQARQLEESVAAVRDELAKTRLRAIDSGRIYAFYYEPEGVNYFSIPYEPDEMESLESSNTQSAPAKTVHGAEHAGTLMKGQRFLQQVTNGRSEVANVPKEWLANLENSFVLAQKSFAIPILFYPDGSATQAQLEIVDDKKQKMRLTIRDLTGGVKVSEIEGEGD